MSRKIYLTEEQFRDFIKYTLNEDVYVNAIRNGKANLTYTRGAGRNKGTKNPFDYIKTDKMDEQNADTYEVTLKGGVTCYNITSIKGNEVMHYFKRLWDNEKTTLTVKNEKNKKEEMELTMLKQEENQFFDMFKRKVGFVVNYCINKFQQIQPEISFNGISIYPVPSSSKFNSTMAFKLSEQGLYDYPVQVVNSDIFLKNLKNLERDEEFIEKNKEIYQSPFFANSQDKTSLNTYLDKSINRQKVIQIAKKNVPIINALAETMLHSLYAYHDAQKKNRNSRKSLVTLANQYKEYYDLVNKTIQMTEYYNPVTGQNSKVQFDSIANIKKYSKGASIEERSGELWQIVKPYLRNQKSDVTGKPYKQIDLVYFDEAKFQIKDFTNGERMGLRNIYNINDENPQLVQQELEKIKGTVFVIFDDNISGGATLSDLCYQCTKAGIKNIIPITFGEMNEKWTFNRQALTKPSEMVNGHAQWNF